MFFISTSHLIEVFCSWRFWDENLNSLDNSTMDFYVRSEITIAADTRSRVESHN